MRWTNRDHKKTRMDGHKGAIGDVVLRIIKRGDPVTPEAICATLTREGQDRAAAIIAEAQKIAAGNAPPAVITTKARKRR
jgi:hypothetical protein